MIKYNTSDLIRRAEQLADLENSDFISWNENIMAINEAYQTVYQKAINHGEQYYLKCCDLGSIGLLGDEVCYALPSDFYQLYSLNVKESGMSIPRKTINGSRHTLSYDLVNNQLVIYGSCSGVLELKYYPEPKGLSYKAKDVSVEIPKDITEGSTIDVYDRYICYIRSSPRKELRVYNWETKEDFLITELEVSVEKIIAGKNGVLIMYTYTDSETQVQELEYTLYTYPKESIPSVKTNIPNYLTGLDDDKNIVYLSVIGFGGYGGASVIIPNGAYISLGENLTKKIQAINEAMVITKEEANLARVTLINRKYIEILRIQQTIKDQGRDITFTFYNYLLNIENDSIDTETIESYPYSEVINNNKFNDILNEKYHFYNNSTKYSVISLPSSNNWSNNLIIENGSSKEYIADVIGVMKLDSNTGYGTMIKTTSNSVLIKSIFLDTQIDYPNNSFLNLLSYQLALYYKTKQGGDMSNLMVVYQQAENQFYDSLPRDDYSPIRIQNVY